MVVVVASMVIILVTAVVVLIAVFGMHLIARSPRARILLRRWALATGAWAYAVRREMAYRVRLLGRYARRRIWPHVARTNKTRSELVPVTALFADSARRSEARSDGAEPRRSAR